MDRAKKSTEITQAGADQQQVFRRTVGRPKQDEVAENRKDILFTNTEWKELNDSLPEGEKLATYLRRIVMERVRAGEGAQVIHPAMLGTDSFGTEVFTKSTCGPWREILEGGRRYVISPDVAETLELRDGDKICVADGDSMEEAGIFDGAYLVVRPYGPASPRRNDICLIQTFDEYGQCQSTIKRWMGMQGNAPRLVNGAGEPVEIPEGTTKVDAVARIVGAITRF